MWPLSEGLHIQQASTRYQLCNISWIQANCFKQYHAHKTRKNPLDLLPTALIFNGFLEVVGIHVPSDFYQTKWSGAWVIVFTEKKATKLKTILPSLPQAVQMVSSLDHPVFVYIVLCTSIIDWMRLLQQRISARAWIVNLIMPVRHDNILPFYWFNFYFNRLLARILL